MSAITITTRTGETHKITPAEDFVLDFNEGSDEGTLASNTRRANKFLSHVRLAVNGLQWSSGEGDQEELVGVSDRIIEGYDANGNLVLINGADVVSVSISAR